MVYTRVACNRKKNRRSPLERDDGNKANDCCGLYHPDRLNLADLNSEKGNNV